MYLQAINGVDILSFLKVSSLHKSMCVESKNVLFYEGITGELNRDHTESKFLFYCNLMSANTLFESPNQLSVHASIPSEWHSHHAVRPFHRWAGMMTTQKFPLLFLPWSLPQETGANDRDVPGVEIVKAIKMYNTSALTPWPPRYPPAQNSYSLPNWQSVFNLFFPSLLEIGETKINSPWQAI